MLSIISKKIIKPFTPTPSTHRWHKLSWIDQRFQENHQTPHAYMPFVFFYPKSQLIGPKQVSNLLSNSLSKILSYYYPWAGSPRDNATTIECDDHGTEFLEVQINSPMDKVASHPDSNVKDLTFPQALPWAYRMDHALRLETWRYGMDRALSVAQLSHFDCGGVALSVSLSHAIGDASSAYCFLRDWAALARSANTSPSPYFIQDSIGPSPIGGDVPLDPHDVENCVHKRFIFTSTQLSALKSSIGLQNVTRSEAVSALLYKCAASSATIVNSGSFKPSQLFQLADLRGIISPPLPPNSIGNLITPFCSPVYDNEEELRLPKLVTDIRKSKNILSSGNILRENKHVRAMLDRSKTEEDQRKPDLYVMSNICKFPFLQDLDFGFGKPIAINLAKGPGSKYIFLMRTNDGGIEALVNLNEEEMCVFEHDKQLLQFATPVDANFLYKQ